MLRPYCANVRPHSPHTDGPAFGSARGGACLCGGLPPLLRAARAAADALVRARAMARFSGSATYLRWPSRLRRRAASARHSSEQYRSDRRDATNPLPHSLQSMRSVLAASLSALAAHRLQKVRAPRPYGAKVRPHSLQAVRTGIAPRIGYAAIRLAGRPSGHAPGRARSGRAARAIPPPPFASPAPPAAFRAPFFAAATARISGSALILRLHLHRVRRAPSAPRALEQRRTARLAAANAVPHALHLACACGRSPLAAHRPHYECRPRPHCPRPRPHIRHSIRPAGRHRAAHLDSGYKAGLPAAWMPWADGVRMRLPHQPPAPPPLRAARDSLSCASARARFAGSALSLRLLSRRPRRAPSARHAFEQ